MIEPDTVPSSAHPPSKNPASSRYPSTVPPSDQSPTHKISPYHGKYMMKIYQCPYWKINMQ